MRAEVAQSAIREKATEGRLRNRLPSIVYYGYVYLALLAGAAIIFVPFWWAVSTAFKLPQNIFLDPPQWIPNPWTLQNFRDALNAAPFWTFAKNTMIICAWRSSDAKICPSPLGASPRGIRSCEGYSME